MSHYCALILFFALTITCNHCMRHPATRHTFRKKPQKMGASLYLSGKYVINWMREAIIKALCREYSWTLVFAISIATLCALPEPWIYQFCQKNQSQAHCISSTDRQPNSQSTFSTSLSSCLTFCQSSSTVKAVHVANILCACMCVSDWLSVGFGRP